jgi:hypothetical protein
MSTLRVRFALAAALTSFAVVGCSAAADDRDDFETESDSAELAVATLTPGKVSTATLGCAPSCSGTAWIDGCTGKVITYTSCAGQAAYCDKVGTLSEGWYATSGALLTKATCSGLATTNLSRKYAFTGRAGQRVDILVDGLLQRSTPALTGLDTTMKVTRAKSASWSVSNDNSAAPGFIVRNNPAPNAKSSSVHGLVLPTDDTYYVTVSAMAKRQGSIEVLLRNAM